MGNGTETNDTEEVYKANEGGDEQVEGVEEKEAGADSDEGGLDVMVDAPIEATAEEEGNDMPHVKNDEEEDEAADEAELASVDTLSEHDGSKGV